MATKYPISKAEFKRRVRMMYGAWPASLLVMNDEFEPDTPGCILQTCLETNRWQTFGGLVSGVSGKSLLEVAELHDDRQYSEALAAVEAL